MPRHDGEGWVPLSDPSGTPSGTARRDVALDSADELYRAFADAPALRRALDFERMSPWQRRLLRPNWALFSNAFFGIACVCYLVASWPPLYDVERVWNTRLSGRRLQDLANLAGCLLFVIEPVFDLLAVWVECWDDILWTAREEQENPSWPDWSASSAIRQSGAPPPRSSSSSWVEQGLPSVARSSRASTTREGPAAVVTERSGEVWSIMIRKWHFWGALLFEIGSLLYCWWCARTHTQSQTACSPPLRFQFALISVPSLSWQINVFSRMITQPKACNAFLSVCRALVPFLYAEADQCYECTQEDWHDDIWFKCVNETGQVRPDGGPPGFCNVCYIGGLVFVANGAVAVIGWRAYRHEVTDMIGSERRLCTRPRCSCGGGGRLRGGTEVDWLGYAAIIFLIGAGLDVTDEFLSDPVRERERLFLSLLYI